MVRPIVWLSAMLKARRSAPAGQLAFAFGQAVAAPNHPPVSSPPAAVQQVAVRAHVRRTKTGTAFVHGHQAKRKRAIVVARQPTTAPLAWIDRLLRILRAGRDVHPATVEAVNDWKRVWKAAMANPRGFLEHHIEVQGQQHFPDVRETRRVATGALMDNLGRLVRGRIENANDQVDEWGRPTAEAVDLRTARRKARTLLDMIEHTLKRPTREAERGPNPPSAEVVRQREAKIKQTVADLAWRAADGGNAYEGLRALKAIAEGYDEVDKLDGDDFVRFAKWWPEVRTVFALQALMLEGDARGGYDTVKHIEEGWGARRLSSLNHLPAGPTATFKEGTSFDLELYEILWADPEKGEPGFHWGEALLDNPTAVAVSALGNHGTMRDKARALQRVVVDARPADKLKALAYRTYAQTRLRQMDDHYSRAGKAPRKNLYRGMTLPRSVIDQMAAGDTRQLWLTGATAFTFVESIADHYARSTWTKTQVTTTAAKGEEAVSVKLVLKRSAKVDDSIAFWNEPKANEGKWGFEVLTTLQGLRITRFEPARDGEVATIYVEAPR